MGHSDVRRVRADYIPSKRLTGSVPLQLRKWCKGCRLTGRQSNSKLQPADLAR